MEGGQKKSGEGTSKFRGFHSYSCGGIFETEIFFGDPIHCSSSQRIPHPPESESLVVLHIHGREFRHALRAERERGAGVVEPAEGEVLAARLLPEVVVQCAAFERKTKEPPARMAAVGLDDCNRFVASMWMLEHGGVAEQAVEFREDKVDIALAAKRAWPLCFQVFRAFCGASRFLF